MNVQQLKMMMEIQALKTLQNKDAKLQSSESDFNSMLQNYLLSGDFLSSPTNNNDITKTKSLPAFTSAGKGNENIDHIVNEAAERYNLPSGLIHAVINQESGYRTDAVSKAGARGLMQLMPATAKGLGVSDVHDPRENVMGGAKYLRQMLDRYGRLDLALAAYNAGPGNVDKYNGIPPFSETQNYVKKIMNALQ